MSNENLLDANLHVPDAQEAFDAQWKMLFETASAVLRCSKTPKCSKEEVGCCKKSRREVVHEQTYTLVDEDLQLVTKYVGVFSHKFRFKEDRDGIYQDVIVEILRTNYLGRYDSTKNTKAGYISRFVYNHFCKRYKVKNYLVNKASSLDNMVWEPQTPTADCEASSLVALESLASVLEEEHSCTSGVRYDGAQALGIVYIGEEASEGQFIVWRSIANIFRLTAMGFLQDEIAIVFNVSKGWISKQVDRIRKTEEVREWAQQHGIKATSSRRSK